MLGVLGDNPAAQPLYFGARGAHQHVASEFYLVVAVALPSMLLLLIGLRVLSAPARWAGSGQSSYGGWTWRAPYEAFVIAFPVAAMAIGEWVAVVALDSGSNRSIGANGLILADVVGLLAMGISAVRSRRFLVKIHKEPRTRASRWRRGSLASSSASTIRSGVGPADAFGLALANRFRR